jgi:serine/threonine protein kinase
MPSMHLKLGDFGISKFVKDKTNSNLNLDQLEENDLAMTQNVGTLRYMAPEVYDDTDYHEYTYKVDIWSTSMVFYMLWEKYPPNIPGLHNNIKVNEYRKLLCKGNRPHFYITPPVIQKLIKDGWQFDETKRPDALTWLEQIKNLKKQWIYDIKMKLMFYI